MLDSYFMSNRYEEALDQFASFARKQDWRMSYRAELYEHAQEAFDLELPLERRQAAFVKVYNGLDRNFGVFRNSTGGHWDVDRIFKGLTEDCKPVGRGSGRTLALLRNDAKDLYALEDSIHDLAGIKKISEYPHMPASKFLHFYNPKLFPIYDRQVIWEQVLCGPFKSEWQGVCRRMGIIFAERSGKFNISYTRWAAENIQKADPSFMPYFAAWFCKEAQIGADTLPGLESYYATAFEFVAIGAMIIAKGDN